MPDNNGVQYTNPPQSRNEAILESMITGEPYTDPPQSRIEDLLLQIKNQGISGGSLTEEIKEALLACFENVSWANANGMTYYTALEEALNAKKLSSISAVLSGTYDTSDTISEVTSNIAVTATYSDTTTANVTSSAVFDTSQVDMTTAGTYSIGVSYTEGGVTKTTTVSLTVAAAPVKELSSISAVLSGTYDTSDTISEVTSNIAVTATYSDTTTANVTSSAVFDTSQVDMTTAGTYSIGVSYTEGGVTKTTSVSLTVAQGGTTPVMLYDVSFAGSVAQANSFISNEGITRNAIERSAGTYMGAAYGSWAYYKIGSDDTYQEVIDGQGKPMYYKLTGTGVDNSKKVGLNGGVKNSATGSSVIDLGFKLEATNDWTPMLDSQGNAVTVGSGTWLSFECGAGSNSGASFPVSLDIRLQICYMV